MTPINDYRKMIVDKMTVNKMTEDKITVVQTRGIISNLD